MHMAFIKDRKNLRICIFNLGYDKINLGLQVCSEIIVSIRSDIKVYGLFKHRVRVLLFKVK